MKLVSFRVKNYRSIVDSQECHTNSEDDVYILAGQNESGKSSILQALRDYSRETISLEAFNEYGLPEISCTYAIRSSDFDLDGIVPMSFPDSVKSIIKKQKRITFTRQFQEDGSSVLTVNDDLFNALEATIKRANDIAKKNGTSVVDTYPLLFMLFRDMFEGLPALLFFDDFCDQLPDEILLDNLISNKKDTIGYQAVRNIETILRTKFDSLLTLTDERRERKQADYHEVVTAQFNAIWKQRLSDGDGAKIHIKYYHGKGEKGGYLKFFIETRKGEYLAPSKRSRGFRWFLSFYLHLMAESQRSTYFVLLFDEPGLYLHARAQTDMLSVFDELAKSHQVVYSTHSPYLIDTARLHRLRLIVNTKSNGTTIEKITTTKTGKHHDSLKPIIDAVGLDMAQQFAIGCRKNLIVEGFSDYFYFNAMKHILGKEYSLGILPSMGASNVHLLMELCIGWGLDWVICFDDKGAVKDYNKIRKLFFDDNEREASLRIFRMQDCDGVEDAFAPSDLGLVVSDAKPMKGVLNSEVVQQHGGKVLFAKLFYEKAYSGEISKSNLSDVAIRNFGNYFLKIEKALGLK